MDLGEVGAVTTAREDRAILASWCTNAARRATAWLEAELLAEIGQVPPSATFGDGYAGILASCSQGEPEASSLLLDYAARHWMVYPGEYHLLDEPDRQRQRSLLRSSCLLLAASRRGRVDLLSRSSVERTLSYQHRCGGFFDMDPGQGQGLVQAFTTAWAGRVALRFSWHERARQAALLLAEMLYMQPDPEGRFYFIYESSNSALATRWREREPQARYVDFSDTAGETHQVAMALALLAEMHLSDPGGSWERPLLGYARLLRRWNETLLGQPAMATVAEALALVAWALPDRLEDLWPAIQTALRGVASAQTPMGSFVAWNCGVGPEYDRVFGVMEATGWTAVCLQGVAQALTASMLDQ